jgi:hypothetical protein
MLKLALVDEPGSGHIFIEQVERCDIMGRSQRWLISVRIGASDWRGTFQGQIHAWFFDEDIETFLDQLRECERTRRGEARLEAMSPEEFSMRIFNTDSSGHFAISYKINYLRVQTAVARMADEHTLDPSLLPKLLRDFEEFLLREDEPEGGSH